MQIIKFVKQAHLAMIASQPSTGTLWRSDRTAVSDKRSRMGHRLTRPSRLCLFLLALGALAGCDNHGQSPGAKEPLAWPQAAIVADLSSLPTAQSAETALADLHAIGFDTVLFDARVTPPNRLRQWLETAKSLQLRSVVRFGEPAEVLPQGSTDPTLSKEGLITSADGLVVHVDDATDLESAHALKAALKSKDYATALIAQVAVEPSFGGPKPGGSSPDEVFDAMLFEDASEGILSLLNPAGATPSEFAARYHQDGMHETRRDAPSHWHWIPHCRADKDRRCSEDIRLLVLGLMLAPAAVTGVIDEPYWRDVSGSLIELRKQTRLLRTGNVDWYAADDEAGVLAYRISNGEGQTMLVAVNLADEHHELPLPFGFMSVSKIQLWTSYDPLLRELVTSKPVALPARSAVVVIRH